jgi:dynein intermediate chain 2
MPDDMQNVAYIWDVNSPNAPSQALNPNSPLVCLEYNPKSSEHGMVAGGSYNGIVSFWDLRNPEQPTHVIDKAHHDPVYDIKWIQSRAGNECVSVSTDGRMLWWDQRNLGAGFIDSLVLKEEKTTYGGMSMAYNSTAGATKYLVGSEQGYVLLCDRKAKKDAESSKSIKMYGKPGAKHHGPIYSIERNPIHHKSFLTVGDWSARIWTEELRTPIMTTRYETSYLTAACWSPTRPGVYFTTKEDGTFDVWDIYYKQNDPTFSTKVTDSPLCAIKVEKTTGSLVAIGSKDGTCTILKMSSGLAVPHPDEKNQMGLMFERETKRERNLDQRATVRKREAKDRNKPQPAAFDPFADEEPALREQLDKIEAAFYEKLQLNRDGTSSAPPAEKAPEPAAEEEKKAE